MSLALAHVEATYLKMDPCTGVQRKESGEYWGQRDEAGNGVIAMKKQKWRRANQHEEKST